MTASRSKAVFSTNSVAISGASRRSTAAAHRCRSRPWRDRRRRRERATGQHGLARSPERPDRRAHLGRLAILAYNLATW